MSFRVGDYLREMHRVDSIHCFQLEDEAAFNQHVYFERGGNSLSLVLDVYGLIAHDAKAGQPQFDDHAFVIDGFQQPWPQRAVNLDRAPDHLLCERIDVHGGVTHATCESTKRTVRNSQTIRWVGLKCTHYLQRSPAVKYSILDILE